MINRNNLSLLIIVIIAITLAYITFLKNSSGLILLTWDDADTSHTMTINYLSTDISENTAVHYDTVSHEGLPEAYRYKTQSKLRTHAGINFNVYSTRLDNLDPEEVYYFIVGDDENGYSEERKFKTIPLRGEIRFVSGGDAGVTPAYSKISKIAAQSNPHFAILGGDIAYANGDLSLQHYWTDLLTTWQQTMITPDGLTIPVIAIIGNHEVNTKEQPATQPLSSSAPFFDLIFRPAEDKTFFKRQIGKDNILFVLDSDHVYSSDGEQLQWMREHFPMHQNDKFRFSSYHVPLYPSYYPPDEPQYERLRDNWLDVFDSNKIQIAFENHEHTLKKSRMLKNDEVSTDDGTIYLGDGAWGTLPREPKTHWYLETTRAVNHIWSITIDDDDATFKALTLDGTDDEFSFSIKSNTTTEPES